MQLKYDIGGKAACSLISRQWAVGQTQRERGASLRQVFKVGLDLPLLGMAASRWKLKGQEWTDPRRKGSSQNKTAFGKVTP